MYRAVPSKTQSYDTIDLRNQICPCITKVAAVLAAGRPSERIFVYRYEHFTKEFRRATSALGLKDIVPYLRRHHRFEQQHLLLDHQSGSSLGRRSFLRENLQVSVRGLHLGVSEVDEHVVPTNAAVEIEQQHRAMRKFGETGADPVRPQQKVK